MPECKQLLNTVPRHNLDISLERLFDPFGSPGKYFLKFAHPRRFTCVFCSHSLQASFLFSPGVFPPLGEDFSLFIPVGCSRCAPFIVS